MDNFGRELPSARDRGGRCSVVHPHVRVVEKIPVGSQLSGKHTTSPLYGFRSVCESCIAIQLCLLHISRSPQRRLSAWLEIGNQHIWHAGVEMFFFKECVMLHAKNEATHEWLLDKIFV